MRTCNKCKVAKDESMFGIDQRPNRKPILRTFCKKCENDQARERERKKRALALEFMRIQEEALKKERELMKTWVAGPRTFNTFFSAPWNGKQESVFIRNDGNKHIKSRGM